MKVKILDRAEQDLIDGYHFYESQTSGLGSYFFTSLYSDIEIITPLWRNSHESSP
jgi:hypothetical protein